ncbi:DKNYY domain-containing protein [Burkholderia sp. Ac-20353]|uniref:DKNYY domain-containing protein n=1 Tax=Burkholderia sp. Ac-20353 TaxID=2703894 RepID=UPI00197B507C|nr:DKNYY domain-containing protein [Burkholderia sp. Ac-20353]MBN3787379.1 hypothetical protein [Burkholderia sp. Ac-20353]
MKPYLSLAHELKRLKVLFLALCAISGFSSQAHAHTTSTCEETWYVPAPGQEFSGKRTSWKEVRKSACATHNAKVMGAQRQTWDDYNDEGSGARQAGTFAIVNEKGYFIRSEDVYQGPYCGRGDVAGFDAQCFLPRAARHNEVHRYRYYYQVTSTPKFDLVAGCSPTYATDGQSVFYLTSDHSHEEGSADDTPFRVVGADIQSFKCFVPEGSKDDKWALDANHVFFDGREAKGMSTAYPVRVFEDRILNVSDLAINGENAFSVDYTDGVKWLNKVDGELKILSKAFYADRKNVFDQSFRKIDGLSPDQFSVVTPVCPIPGQPDLRCVAPTGQNDSGGYGIQDGMLVIPRGSIEGSKKIAIKGLNARNAVVFLLHGTFSSVSGVSAFMLFNDRLYSMDALDKGRVANGMPVHGRLRSLPEFSDCVLNGDHGAGLWGYVLDDAGGIDMTDMKHVGPCTH